MAKIRKNTNIKLCVSVNEGHEQPLELKDIVYLFDDSPRFLDKENKVIFDAWKKPISIEYIKPHKYKYTSFGPDKQNDNGKDDDIVMIFDTITLEQKIPNH